jgi:biotin transport system substrate-specific component
MKNKDITQVALLTAVMVVLASIPAIPLALIPVPLVLQNFAVMLAGPLLGAQKGTLSVGILLLLATLGLPVLTGFRGGLAVVLGPTGGYLLAWLLTPMAMTNVHYFLQHHCHLGANSYWNWWLTLIMVSIILTYPLAIIWLMWQTHITFMGALTANMLFIPGDLIKIALAGILISRLWPVLRMHKA